MGNKNRPEWLQQLSSPNSEERMKGLATLHKLMHSQIEVYLDRLLKNNMDVEEIHQKTFLRLIEMMEAGKLDATRSTGEIYNLVYRIAHNLAMDVHRERTRHPTTRIEAYSYSQKASLHRSRLESHLQETWIRDRVRTLLHHTPNEETRISWLLHAAGYSVKQISRLLPWAERTVYRHTKETLELLVRHYKADPNYERLNDERLSLLPYPDGQGQLGITVSDAQPKGFSSTTKQALCQYLGLAHFEELQEEYCALLIIHDAYTSLAHVRLAFVPHAKMELTMLRGDPLPYLDGVPHFERKDGVEKLFLEELRTYKAWPIDRITLPEPTAKLIDWRYEIEGASIQVRKYPSSAPMTKPQPTYFRARPINSS